LASIDRPALEALALARRSLVTTTGRAAIGLAMIAAASAIATLIGRARGAVELDVLRAGLEAIAVVLPLSLVALASSSSAVSPRVLLAAIALGLLAGGVSAVALLPLMAFLALVDHGAAGLIASPSFLVPVVALAAVLLVPLRVTRAIDASLRTLWAGRGFALLLCVVFALRLGGSL
jgi:hypothetical protein